MLRWSRILLALLVMILWIAPMLGAVAVSFHVAFEHHGEHDDGALPALVEMAVHGHHHEGAVLPHHQHEGIEGSGVRISTGLRATIAVSTRTSELALRVVDEIGLRGSSRRGPPPDLISRNCSLLL